MTDEEYNRVQRELPRWTIAAGEVGWVAIHPNPRTGLSVEARKPDELIGRVRALVRVMTMAEGRDRPSVQAGAILRDLLAGSDVTVAAKAWLRDHGVGFASPKPPAPVTAPVTAPVQVTAAVVEVVATSGQGTLPGWPPYTGPLSSLSGYTGNACTDCGGTRMVRSGACEKCEDCGASSGCS